MDASEFEGLLYNMLSEEPFSNHRLDMTDEKDDYTISDYVSQHFGITIGETCTCLTCHATKPPKIFNYFSFILLLGEISQKGGKMRPISHEKMTHLEKSCVTMTDLMDKFYEKMILVILYVNNAPRQAVQPGNLILKKIVLKSPMQ